MDVILIGAGRYGHDLVGRKHKTGAFNTKLKAVVDPNIEQIREQDDYYFNGIKTFKNFNSIPKSQITKETIAEIATNPEIIPKIFKDITHKGVRNVILPKPITSDSVEFEKIAKTAKQNKMKVAVASNWYYSDITKLTKALIEKATGKHVGNKQIKKKYKKEINSITDKFSIEKVEIEYNKKQEKLVIDPPSQELPHALQILKSTGLSDLNNLEPVLEPDKQSASRVNVKYDNVSGIKRGVELNSDLNMGDKLDKRRERVLKIYLNDEDKEPDIIADYDAVFDSQANCLKPASVTVDITKNNQTVKWTKEIVEDNIDTMYHKMMNFFKNRNSDVLTLDKYRPISKQICKIQSIWENIVRK